MAGMSDGDDPGFGTLKDKQRSLRSGFPEPLGLRVHRALSWYGRSTQSMDDIDIRFILLWVAFNAAYAQDVGGPDAGGERSAFRTFFEALVSLDRSNRIYNVVWKRFPNEIRVLLNNRFVFAPFWNHQNGVPGSEDWAATLAASQKVIASAMARQDTGRLLSIVFDRLYVLRNQIVHGGATWNSSVNRSQVRDGAAVLASLLPVFIDIMMDNPQYEWGRPFYPVVENVGEASSV
jgi:hypothetical protein